MNCALKKSSATSKRRNPKSLQTGREEKGDAGQRMVSMWGTGGAHVGHRRADIGPIR